MAAARRGGTAATCHLRTHADSEGNRHSINSLAPTLESTTVDIAETFQVTVTRLNVLKCEPLHTRLAEVAISMFES
jgi:hypothetical protein